MLHARSTVVVPTPSDIPSLLLCAIRCAAHIVSLLSIPKMRPFGLTHIFLVFVLNPRIAKCEVIKWYVRMGPFPPYL
jgi:hypothetical protein